MLFSHWIPKDFLMTYEAESAEQATVANKSKAFKAAIDKLEVERISELSGTSPIHSKSKMRVSSASSSQGSRKKEPNGKTAPRPKRTIAPTSYDEGDTSAMEEAEFHETLSIASSDNVEDLESLSQRALKEVWTPLLVQKRFSLSCSDFTFRKSSLRLPTEFWTCWTNSWIWCLLPNTPVPRHLFSLKL